MARKTTIRAFEEWVKDASNVDRVLELIAGGVTLHKAAVAVKQPYTCLHPFLHSTPEIEARYLAARKAWVDLKKDQAFEIAENVEPDRDHVAKAKLQIDVIDNQAKAYHREKWGDKVQVDRSGGAPADEKLLGFASELLKLVKGREPRIVPGQAVTESPSAALPAPEVK